MRHLDPRLGLFVLGITLAAAGCQARPAPETTTTAPSRTLTAVLESHRAKLMAIPGVVATAESQLDDGRSCILVLVERLTPELRAQLPHDLEGWPVKVEESGAIRALPDSAR